MITSHCNRLDRVMILLAFLDSLGISFMLATIEIVDCKFYCLPITILHPIQFPFAMHGTVVYLSLDGAK